MGKRLVKSPKLYFNDTALCSYLLGLNDAKSLKGAPNFGNLFETLIICDFWKRFLHFGEKPSMYYLRSRDDLEIDLVIEIAGNLHLFEIKSAMTITPKHAVSLQRIAGELGNKIQTQAVISCAQNSFKIKGEVMNYNWQTALSF